MLARMQEVPLRFPGQEVAYGALGGVWTTLVEGGQGRCATGGTSSGRGDREGTEGGALGRKLSQPFDAQVGPPEVRR